MKKTVVWLFALLFVLLFTGCSKVEPSLPQDQSVPKAEPIPLAQKQERLLSIADSYLADFSELIVDKDCFLGKAVPLYCLTTDGLYPGDYEWYPVFSGDWVVMNVTGFTSPEGEYITGAGKGHADEIQACITRYPDEPLALVYVKEGLCLVYEQGGIELIEVPVTGIDGSVNDVDTYRNEMQFTRFEKDVPFQLP